jgi:hypothetical protein
MQLFSRIIFFSGFIFLSSCSPENYINIGQIQSIKINGLEDKGISCQAEIEIENKYFLPFKIYPDELKVYTSEQVLGRIVSKGPIHIFAKQKKVYKIEFKVVLGDEYSGLLSIIQKLSNSHGNYSIRGNIKARSFIIKRRIPIDMHLNDF